MMNGTQLWLLSLPEAEDEVSVSTQALLSPAEQTRASRFVRPADANRYIAARVALRIVLGTHLGLAAYRVPLEVTDQGKPCLPDQALQFNVSHSGSWALLAVHPRMQLGVDLEVHKPWQDMDTLAATILHPDEAREWAALTEADKPAALFTVWSRKEACVKATGTGLTTPPELVLTGVGPGPRRGQWRPFAGPTIGWQDLELAVPQPHSACIAWVLS